MARQPGHGGPRQQAANNDAAAAEAIGQKTGKGAQRSVHPKEHGGEQTKLRVGHRDRFRHRLAHRRQHDAIEVIQQRHEPKQAHTKPGSCHGGGRWHHLQDYYGNIHVGGKGHSIALPRWTHCSKFMRRVQYDAQHASARRLQELMRRFIEAG